MIWTREPNSVNDKPSYLAGTSKADYRIVPVSGGFRLHYKVIDSNTWACGEWHTKLKWTKEMAASLDSQLGPAIPSTVCAEFREFLRETGSACQMPKTPEQVYELWREYTRVCSNYDQSPVKSEFLEWYKDQLR